MDGELQLWEQHWKNSKAVLPDSVSATLKRINFPCFPIIKTALQYLVQYLLHLVHAKDHFHLWSYKNL